MIAHISRSADRLAARRLSSLETCGNDSYPHLVAQRVIDDSTEDDVGLLVRCPLDQVGGSRDLEQAEV
jgi:hypothetical protein